MKKTITILAVLCVMIVIACCLVGCGSPVKLSIDFIVDGEVYYTFHTAGNELVNFPQNPVKEGYRFDAWYWDDGIYRDPLTVSSLCYTPLTSNMRVYAKWIKEGAVNQVVSNDEQVPNQQIESGEVLVETEDEFVFKRNLVTPRAESDNPVFGTYTSYYDLDGYAVSMYYLGKVNNVLLEESYSAYLFDGKPITHTLSISDLKEYSVQNAVEKATSQTVSYQFSDSQTFGGSLRIGKDSWPLAATITAEGTNSKTTGREYGTSFLQSYQNAYRFSQETTRTMTVSFNRNDYPLGSYRYGLFGNLQVYGVYAYNLETGASYMDTRAYVVSQLTYLDYDKTGEFLPYQCEPLQWDAEVLDYFKTESMNTTSKYHNQINYDLDGGGFDCAVITSYIYDGNEHALPIPTRTGYVFAGWYLDSNYHNRIKSTDCGPLNLVAHWVSATVDSKRNIFVDNKYQSKYGVYDKRGRVGAPTYTYEVSSDLYNAIADGFIGVYVKASFHSEVRSDGNTTSYAIASLTLDDQSQTACTASAKGKYVLWQAWSGDWGKADGNAELCKQLTAHSFTVGAHYYLDSDQENTEPKKNDIFKQMYFECISLDITYYNIK